MTPVDRRAFLWTAASGVVAMLAGEWWARERTPTTREVTPTRIARAEAVRPGEAMGFSLPDAGIDGLVVRLMADRWAAFDRRCPHLGCPVLWSVADGLFVCPCHAATFDAESGAVLSGPPRRGLGRLGLEMLDGAVWVRQLEPTDT